MKSPSHRLGPGLLLGTLSAFGPLSMDLYLPALPALQTSLMTSTTMAQLSITANLMGLALGQIVIGPLSDRYGRRMPLQLGLLLFTLASAGIALVPNIWLLIGLRVLQGIGGAAGQVLARAIASDWYQGPALTRFMALLMAVNGIFPIISPSLGSLVMMVTTWRGIFWLLALIGLALMVISWLALPESLPPAYRRQNLAGAVVAMATLVKHPRFMSYVAVQGLAYGALFTYISGSSFVYQKHYGVSVAAFALLYAANGLGIVLGTRLVDQWARRFSSYQLFLTGAGSGAGAGILLVINALLLDQLWVMLIGLFIMLVSFGVVNTTATSLAMAAEPQLAGGASALIGLANNLVGGIFSPLVGLFATTASGPMASLILLSFGAAFALAWLRRTHLA